MRSTVIRERFLRENEEDEEEEEKIELPES
jgi:hypothetical protein